MKKLLFSCSLLLIIGSLNIIASPSTSGGKKKKAMKYDCHDNSCNIVAYGNYCSSGGSGCAPNDCPGGTQE